VSRKKKNVTNSEIVDDQPANEEVTSETTDQPVTETASETVPETAPEITDSEPIHLPPSSLSDDEDAKRKDEELKQLLEQSKRMQEQLEYYDKFTEKKQELQSLLNDAKNELKEVKEKVKYYDEQLDRHIGSMKKPYCPSKFPLIEKESSLPTTETKEEITETKENVSDLPDWKSWLAKDHFDFTDTEWEMISENPIDSITIADFIEFEQRLLSGVKIKGLGKKKREKFLEQFLEKMSKFWEANPELVEVSSTNEAGNTPPFDVDQESDNSNDSDDPDSEQSNETETKFSDFASAIIDYFRNESDEYEHLFDSDNSETESKENPSSNRWNYVPKMDDTEHKVSPIEVQTFLEDIDEMLENPLYAYAEETLAGIHDWAEENQHITKDMRMAVKNIKSKPSKFLNE
jgi:hypothetical protein